ncbi:hypothetical protein [Roseivirga seohaensis]|uniref:hypothetical protein n=1 Tax=Roseivirga seohaensis TaxID=1914963 RepID=UPI003BAD6117
MEKRNVISRKNLPKNLPFMGTLTCILALDYWNAPEWLWGVIGALLLISWIVVIAARLKDTEIDVLDHPVTPQQNKTSFQEALNSKLKASNNEPINKAGVIHDVGPTFDCSLCKDKGEYIDTHPERYGLEKCECQES